MNKQMKQQKFCKSITFSLLFVLLFVQQSFSISNVELKDLYKKKQYFDLRDKLSEFENDKSNELIFYRGAVANKFNSPKKSIKLLKRYLKNASPKDENLNECFSILADNYVKTFQYAKAAETYKILLQKFSAETDEKDKADYENVFNLWKGLRKVPPQKVKFIRNSTIQAVQMEVGLTVPVEINSKEKEYFIFDTGANISTVTESFAKKLNIQIIEAKIDVGSITGEKVKAKLGVAKRLKLGNVLAENVIFLIFPDKALYIEPLKFQMNGIIGFPLISALREITWTKNQEIIISANSRKKVEQNLALDNLTPLIAGKYKGKRLTFSFDTGASSSSFYQPFFQAFEEEVTKSGSETSQKITGVGGTKEIKAYLLKDFEMNFAGIEATFPKVEVLTEKTTGLSQYVYGNIGRDLIDQFEQMTMNFQTMTIIFN